ncbi:hypothetical protein H109_00698 [Trichophyton interdigitale MR816]|nr:hypothetical protein H101_03126 [Trichophyton interdigitale H6]KDB27537.1 hypothetical protein H109_00698 [Trichophyton interdigitale MR816]
MSGSVGYRDCGWYLTDRLSLSIDGRVSVPDPNLLTTATLVPGHMLWNIAYRAAQRHSSLLRIRQGPYVMDGSITYIVTQCRGSYAAPPVCRFSQIAYII